MLQIRGIKQEIFIYGFANIYLSDMHIFVPKIPFEHMIYS